MGQEKEGEAVTEAVSPSDPLRIRIEMDLHPGYVIQAHEMPAFLSPLRETAAVILSLLQRESRRSIALLGMLWTGCAKTMREFDEAQQMEAFQASLTLDYIRAARAADRPPEETAATLLSWMAVDRRAMSNILRPEAWTALDAGTARALEDADRFAAMADRAGPTAADHLTAARLFADQQRHDEALAWIARGASVPGKEPELERLRRCVLLSCGRRREAIESAWREFRQTLSPQSYEDLLQAAPEGARAEWMERALDFAEEGSVWAKVRLFQSVRALPRLAALIRETEADTLTAALAEINLTCAGYALSPVEPDAAGKAHFLAAVVSLREKRGHDVVLNHFKTARTAYQAAGRLDEWYALAEGVLREHRRKHAFIPEFRRVMDGLAPTRGWR